MELSEFLKQKKKCGFGYSFETFRQLKCTSSPNRKRFNLYAYEDAKLFGQPFKAKREIQVLFNERQESLTQFTAGLLFSMWVMNRMPHDYAKYHECIAGQEFIKNIKSVKVKEIDIIEVL